MLLVALLSQLGGNGRLQRNGMIGLRIPSTMSSDQAWVAGHRAAAKPAWVGFIVITVAAVIFFLLSGSTATPDIGVIVIVVIFVATFTWLVVAASRAARVVEPIS